MQKHYCKTMLLINTEDTYYFHPVLKYLPQEVRRYFYKNKTDGIEEIRLKKNLPVTVIKENEKFYLTKNYELSENETNALILSKKQFEQAILMITDNSYYKEFENIKKGYITLFGGCRVGLSFEGVIEDEYIKSAENICGLNYRFAREIIGVSKDVCERLIYNNTVKNTLIISPPGCGKTTFLRDIAKNLSERKIKVSIADERNEISAMHHGVSGFDLGNFCDVMTGIDRSKAIMMMIRSMSPEVIITDEIDGESDIKIIKKAISSGVSVIASVHSRDIKSAKVRLGELFDLFDAFIVLSRDDKEFKTEELYIDD